METSINSKNFDEFSDSAKSIITLLEEHGLNKISFFWHDNIIVRNEGLALQFDFSGPGEIFGDQPAIYLYLVSEVDRFIDEVIDCTEINLAHPESINTIEKWIKRLQHGNS